MERSGVLSGPGTPSTGLDFSTRKVRSFALAATPKPARTSPKTLSAVFGHERVELRYEGLESSRVTAVIPPSPIGHGAIHFDTAGTGSLTGRGHPVIVLRPLSQRAFLRISMNSRSF